MQPDNNLRTDQPSHQKPTPEKSTSTPDILPSISAHPPD